SRIEGNPAAAALAGTGSNGSLRALLFELLEASLDLPVTGSDLVLIEVNEFDGLLKCKQMLFPVVPLEGACYSGLGALAARIAKTAKNGSYDPHARQPGDIANHVGKL